MDETTNTWGFELEFAVCERCDWKYLFRKGAELQLCPHCFGSRLAALDSSMEELSDHMAYLQPPELCLPFSLSSSDLAGKIEYFSKGIPYPPADLNPQNLASRMNRTVLPLWLVDAEVQSTWEAETGFDYEVVSHQDRYEDRQGSWTSQQVTERRVRWEPRAGRLRRCYPNIPAPALEKEELLRKGLGSYEHQEAQLYDGQVVGQALVRLPDRSPKDAWADALPAIQAAAAEECREAAGADHIRGFRWSPQVCSQNWTMLLRPVYTTYYLDDDGHPRPVLINGQSGAISGERFASTRRARQAALITLGVALVLFVLSLLLSAASALFLPLLAIGGVGLFVALLVALSAAIPVAVAWQFNRSQR